MQFHKLASLLFKSHEYSQDTAASVMCGTEEFESDDAQMSKGKLFWKRSSQSLAYMSFYLVDMPDEMGLVKDENISLESNESLATSATSGISEPASSPSGSSSCTKRARTEYCSEQQNRRAFLFNKLVQLMPASMVQPERNLSDFVVM